MNLTIDIGNTRTKFAIFDSGNILDTNNIEEFTISSIDHIFLQYPRIESCIISKVRDIDLPILKNLENKLSFYIELDENCNIPIENKYKTKNTLGKDRLAAVIGANNIFPDSNVLVIDMGTAITFDFINKNNQYLGGTISPGLEMRFKALNHFTNKLPLVQKNDKYFLMADNTDEAIISGVQNGIVFEMDGYINNLRTKYEDLKIILTGGDAIFFDKKLKNTIFVNLNLNFIGLNTVLEYNKSI